MKLTPLILVGLAGMTFAVCRADADPWSSATPVYEVLRELGEPMPAHYLQSPEPQAVKRGEEIVKYGFTVGQDGTPSKVQSKYFTCIRCHNTSREDPDLRVADPEARLDYAIQNRLPFLPGTTLYGVVNRTGWFNDDYLRKYGDVTRDARHDLVKAIQLCAVDCSMGRRLDDWEVQAVLAYFWSLQLTLGDLTFSPGDWNRLRQGRSHPAEARELAAWLKSFYLQASPATFSGPPPHGALSRLERGNVEKGRTIYALSCLSCHNPEGVTSFVLDESRRRYRLLGDQAGFDADFSIDKAIRNGIKASPGKGYMPNFTVQRMSDRQILDLAAFLRHQSTQPPLDLEPYKGWVLQHYRRP